MIFGNECLVDKSAESSKSKASKLKIIQIDSTSVQQRLKNRFICSLSSIKSSLFSWNHHQMRETNLIAEKSQGQPLIGGDPTV